MSYKVRDDISSFIKSIPSDVTLVAATKYIDAAKMESLLNAGINNFGENRVEPFLEKYEQLKGKDIVWHFIGHLQRNKAKKVIDKIDYLHSLDSLELASLIEKHRTTTLKVFVEVSINLEENKNGVPYYEVMDFITKLKEYKHIEVVGLMMMSIAHSDTSSLHEQFHKLKSLQIEIQNKLNIPLPYLSMGMSDDYEIAIKEGASHIRLGRILLSEE